MISLTRINGSSFFLNPHQILMVEEEQETHITLYEPDHFLTVTESAKEITDKIIDYRRKLKLNAQEI